MREWKFSLPQTVSQYRLLSSSSLSLFKRGKKSSQTVNHSLIWLAGWVFYEKFVWGVLKPSHSNPRMFPRPLSWIRGLISTFYSVFIRIPTWRGKRGCISCNRSPDWVMSCNNSAGAGWGGVVVGSDSPLGWRWQYTKTNKRDVNAHYTGVNNHNRPLRYYPNKQEPTGR